MKELICTSMVIARNGKVVTVDIDGYVFYDLNKIYRGQSESVRATKIIDVTGTACIDASSQNIEEIGEIALTDAEEEIASERLIFKFLES